MDLIEKCDHRCVAQSSGVAPQSVRASTSAPAVISASAARCSSVLPCVCKRDTQNYAI